MSAAGCLALIIVLGAVDMDLQRQKIANEWLFVSVLLVLWYQMIHAGGKGLAVFVTGSMLPLLLLGGLFFFRMLGAGDIKLLSVLGGLMGTKAILWCIFWSMLFGAFISIVILCICDNWLQRLFYFTNYIKQYIRTKIREPYRLPGDQPEHFHFTVPILMGALLWIGGFY